jgi:hypothetical protein
MVVEKRARVIAFKSDDGFRPEEEITLVVLTGYPDVLPLFKPHLGSLRVNLTGGGWNPTPTITEAWVFALAAEATVKEANATLGDGGYVGGVIQSVVIERTRMMRKNADVKPETFTLGSGALGPTLHSAWL